ncbi:MAG: ABC transporter permease [Saprospiraceae bacterium]
MLKFSIRSLRKNKVYTLINVLGLSLGMTCCFLMLLYCWHEFNYDTFHKDSERLYRIEYSMGRSTGNMSRTPSTIQPVLADYFSEVESSARFYPRALSVDVPKLNRQFELEDVFFVDSTVVDVFSFDFLQGQAKYAFEGPEAVVLSEETAMKLFGRTDVLNNTLTLAGEKGFRVSAVVKDWPDNAHLSFQMLLPYETMYKVEPAHARASAKRFVETNWSATHSYTYVKLKPNTDPAKVDARFADMLLEKSDESLRDKQALSLIPVSDIHLYSDNGGPKPLGNVSYLYLFLFVGVLTLLIASINFVNLTTASAMTRTKNVVVRKLLGAQRSSLISQFMGESVLLSFFAFIIAIGLTMLFLPHLNNLTGASIPYSSLVEPKILMIYFAAFLLTGVFAGLYPAFFISRFKPETFLKGISNSHQKTSNNWLRKGLITVQFLAAIVFITGTLTVLLQIQYLQNRPHGFNTELMLDVPLNSGNNLIAALRPGDVDLRGRMNAFDKMLLENPNISAVTQCSRLPGLGTISFHLSTPSMPLSENVTSKVLSVDYDFYETFELELAAGRDFDASHGTDHINALMINEKMVDLLEWESPEAAIGQQAQLGGKDGQIIGVLKDFHYERLHGPIQPLTLEVNPGTFGHFALRIENKNIPETLAFIEEKWKSAFPEKVFEYSFLQEDINETFQSESRLATIIGYAAFLTIFISCFGLFGLAALLTQQRFKEIGIRKVLGASVAQILALVAKDFMRLIAIAIVIAIPLTWYFLKDWLAQFAFHIEYPWWTTVVSGLTVLLVAFITVSAQSIKAALSNPADAIRDE